MIRKTWMFDAFNKSIFDVSSKLMIMVTLLIYILVQKSPVEATTVFVTLTLANYLRNTITNFLPMAITGLFELRVSINRIQVFEIPKPIIQQTIFSYFLKCFQTFLLLEEKENISINESSTSENGISINNFTARWTKDGHQVVSNASMEVQPGRLTALIGSVGSGKVYN